MIKKLFDSFRKPSPEIIARAELEDAKRELLAAHSSQEYAAGLVQFREHQINRLSAYLKGST